MAALRSEARTPTGRFRRRFPGPSALGIVGDKPATAIDSLAATPSMANDAAVSIAPTVATGAGHMTTTAAAIAAVVEKAAMAVKHVVPRAMARSKTIEVAAQATAARRKFGGAGPPGTARKPATAANAAAVIPRANDGNGSAATRPATIEPTVAATATIAAMMARLLAGVLPEHTSTVAPKPAAHKHAAAPMRRDVSSSRCRCRRFDHGMAEVVE